MHKSDTLGEGLSKHYSGAEYLLKTNLPLPVEIVQPLEDTANEYSEFFLRQNNQSDASSAVSSNIMDSIQRIKDSFKSLI